MRVYELSHTPDVYQHLMFEGKEVWSSLRKRDYFHGKPIAASWTPLDVTTMVDGDNDHRQTRRPSDFPTLGTIPVFSRHAVEALRDILEASGEILPLNFNGETGVYFAFNITKVIDALDELRSEIKRFKDGGVMLVDRYEFQPDKLQEATSFKIPQQHQRNYVTDEFVRRVEESGLTGFSFKELWSDQREKPAHRVA